MRRCLTRPLALVALVVGMGGRVAAGPVADLAPPESILLVEADDYTAFREALSRTPIAAFLHEPDVQDWFASFWTTDAEAWRAETAQRGLNPDRLPRPAGAVGLALWADPAAATPMILHALLSADMGPDADLFERSLDALVESARGDELAASSPARVADLPARRVQLSGLRVGAGAGESDAAVAADTFTLVRVGDTFLASTDPDELARALARRRGQAEPAASARRAYVEAWDRLGPAHLRVTILGEPLLDALDRLMRSDAVVEGAGGVEFDTRAIARALGLATVRALALGVTLDASSAPLEARGVALAPAKEGLLALLDAPIDGLAPRRAVPKATLDVRQFGLRYERVIPLLMAVAESLPDREREQARALIAFLTAAVGPLLQSLGPDTTLVRWRTDDASSGGQRQFFRARTAGAEAITPTLARIGPMIGLRRTLGDTRVWTLGEGQALAVDADAMLIADRNSIDAALAERPVRGEAPLIESPRFRRAMDRLRPGAVFYSFTNPEENIRWLRWREAHWEDLLRAELAELELSRVEIERWVEERRAQRDADGVIRWPEPASVRRHLGDAAAEVRATPWGFEYRGWLLAPTDGAP